MKKEKKIRVRFTKWELEMISSCLIAMTDDIDDSHLVEGFPVKRKMKVWESAYSKVSELQDRQL